MIALEFYGTNSIVYRAMTYSHDGDEMKSSAQKPHAAKVSLCKLPCNDPLITSTNIHFRRLRRQDSGCK